MCVIVAGCRLKVHMLISHLLMLELCIHDACLRDSPYVQVLALIATSTANQRNGGVAENSKTIQKVTSPRPGVLESIMADVIQPLLIVGILA